MAFNDFGPNATILKKKPAKPVPLIGGFAGFPTVQKSTLGGAGSMIDVRPSGQLLSTGEGAMNVNDPPPTLNNRWQKTLAAQFPNGVPPIGGPATTPLKSIAAHKPGDVLPIQPIQSMQPAPGSPEDVASAAPAIPEAPPIGVPRSVPGQAVPKGGGYIEVGGKRYDLADVGTRKIVPNAGIAAEAPGVLRSMEQTATAPSIAAPQTKQYPVGPIMERPRDANGNVATDEAGNPYPLYKRGEVLGLGVGLGYSNELAEAKAAIKQRLGYVPADYLDNRQKYDAMMLTTANDARKTAGDIANQQGILAIDAPYKKGLISGQLSVAKEAADARKYAADQKAMYEPSKTEKAIIDAASKKQERLIAGRALLMSQPEFSALNDAGQNEMLEKFSLDPETETWIPGKAGKDAVSHWFSKNEPAVDPTPGRRVPKVNAPPGMTVIGTSGGKPVFQDAQGNRHIGA